MSLIERVNRVVHYNEAHGWEVSSGFRTSDLRAILTQLEVMQAEIDRLRNFVEEIAGSCIPDYEEAKAEAQGLLGMVNPDYVSDTPRTDRFGRRLRTMNETTELRQVIASALDALEDERPWCAKDTLRASLHGQGSAE